MVYSENINSIVGLIAYFALTNNSKKEGTVIAHTEQTLEEKLLEKYSGDIDALVHQLETIKERHKNGKKQREYGDVVIEMKAVAKQYRVGRQKVAALKGVSSKIRQGEFVAVTGPSGSGKSTFLQIIGALDKPSSGEVLVNGRNIEKLSDRKLSVFRGQTIGFVFQFFYLQPFLNLQRNLEVPSMFAHKKRVERRKNSIALSDKVGLSDRLKHLPNELSGGQMQRAAIARALMNNPKILLADEPTGNLDRENAFAIMDLFDAVRTEFGTTIIVVTHDKELAARADREIAMRDGQVV